MTKVVQDGKSSLSMSSAGVQARRSQCQTVVLGSERSSRSIQNPFSVHASPYEYPFAVRMRDLGTIRGVRVVRFRIKVDRLHEQPLHPIAIAAIEEHLEILHNRGFQIDDPDHALFPSLKTGRNEPVSDEAIRYIFNSALTRAGIDCDSFRRYSPLVWNSGDPMCQQSLKQ